MIGRNARKREENEKTTCMSARMEMFTFISYSLLPSLAWLRWAASWANVGSGVFTAMFTAMQRNNEDM